MHRYIPTTIDSENAKLAEGSSASWTMNETRQLEFINERRSSGAAAASTAASPGRLVPSPSPEKRETHVCTPEYLPLRPLIVFIPLHLS